MNEIVKGFPDTTVEIKKLREFDNRFEISIKGPEEIFVCNMLKEEIGTIHEYKEVTPGKIYKGTMVDVGKVGFGIFVDCAILNPKTDVLINLRVLRNQLCMGKEKSLRKISKAYDFIDHFPVYIKITKIDEKKSNIEGELDQSTLDIFNKLINENLEGVFASGETKRQFKNAIVKSGHFRDIISIKRFGFLENLVILKENTNAPGVIASIGKDLKNCKMSAIIPSRIKELWE